MGEQDRQKGKLAPRLLRALLGSIALLFIVLAAREMYARWDGESVHIAPLWCVVAVVLSSLAMLMQFLAFWYLVRGWSGVAMPLRASFRLYLDSQLARYTPGKVGLMAVRIAGAQRVGIAPRVMTATLLTELLSWCAWGSVVGMSLLALCTERYGFIKQLSGVTLLLAGLALLGVGILSFVGREHLPQTLVQKLGALGSGPLLPRRVGLFHCAHFLCQAASAGALVFSIGGQFSAALLLGAVLCLAIVAGFLALLAPAGAGVREALIAFFVEPMLGASVAVALGILTRAASLGSDICVWAIARLLDRR